MTEVKHTPLPWRLSAGEETAIFAGGSNIARTYSGAMTGIRREAAEANAAFIVTACNSHHAMLEALETAEKTFRWYGDLHAAKPDADKAKRNYDLADEMSAAIRLAKGK